MALNANIRWECRADATAGNVNGGGFRWVNLVSATYKWTASASGTNEYYCEIAAGGNPSLTKASCSTDGNFNLATEGAMGSLTTGQWDYGDNDTLGYNTVYVRLTNGADPDTQPYWTVALGQGGGTDYSQQTTAHLTITDLASDGAGGVSSALTPFDAADVGNVLHITAAGTGFTVGWYEVTSVALAVATLDRSPGLSKTGGTAYLGGALSMGSTLDADFWAAWVDGNIVYIKKGDYTIGENISLADSVKTAPGIVEGYNSTRGDNPTGENRPYFNFGTYYADAGDFNLIKNIIFVGTSTSFVWRNTQSLMVNCKFLNTYSASTTRPALMFNGPGCAINCEFYSASSFGVSGSSDGNIVANCYVHDCAGSGITLWGGTVINNILLHNITSGINVSASENTIVANNTVYGDTALTCTSGIVTAGYGEYIYNNIVQKYLTGIDGSTAIYRIMHNNCINGCTTPYEQYTAAGTNDITSDPAMTNPEGTLIHDCEAAWDRVCDADECTVTADATVYKVGTYAAKFAVTAAADATEIIAADAIISTDMSKYKGIVMWARSSVALTAGDWQFILSDQANGANAIKTFNFPAMTANTWHWIYFDGRDMSAATAIISLAVYQVVDKGAMNFYLDDIRGRDCNFTVGEDSPVIDTGYNNQFLNMST